MFTIEPLAKTGNRLRSLIAAGAASALCFAAPARAGDQFVYNFLKESGCAVLPFSACDVLDIENSLNILRTYQALLVNKFCGYGNIQAAKIGLENDAVLDEPRCRIILKGLRAI